MKQTSFDYESLMENIDQAMMVTEEDEREDISLCDEALDNLNALEFALTDMELPRGMDTLLRHINALKNNLKELKAREEAEEEEDPDDWLTLEPDDKNTVEESSFPIHEAEVAPPTKIGRCTKPYVKGAYYDPSQHACLDNQTDKKVIADEKITCPPGYQPIAQTTDCKIIDQKKAQEFWHGAQKQMGETTHRKRKQTFVSLDYRAPYKGINWQ